MKNNRNSINIQNWFKQVENHLLHRQHLLIPPSHQLWHLCTAWHHCTPGAGCRRCWSQFLTQTPCRLKHNTFNCIPKKFPGKIIKARKAANWRKLITEKFLIKLGKSRSVCKEKKKRNKRQQTCLQVTKGRVNGIKRKQKEECVNYIPPFTSCLQAFITHSPSVSAPSFYSVLEVKL